MDCSHQRRRDHGAGMDRCALCGTPVEETADGELVAASDDDGEVVGP